jgi:hypothetical protein
MLYFFQTQSLKTRFLSVLLLVFPVVGFQWLLTSAPWALAHFQVITHGAGLPDTRFWYTPQGLQTLVDSWGPEGRVTYLTVLWPSDLGFLVSYGALLTAATLYLLKKTTPARIWWYSLVLIPLGAAACDLLENTAVGLAVLFPADAPGVVGWPATVFTAGKWVGVGLSGAVLVVGTLVNLVRRGWDRFRATVPPVASEPPEGPSAN